MIMNITNTQLAIGGIVIVVAGIVFLSTKNKQARTVALIPTLTEMGITVGNIPGSTERLSTLGADSGALALSAARQYAPSRHAGMYHDMDETSPTYGQWLPVIGQGGVRDATLAERQL